GNGSISSLAGIEYFTNLEFLYCDYNQITQVDLAALQNLQSFFCRNNTITSVAVAGLQDLATIDVNYNPSLTTVSISDLPALQTLRFQNGAVGALTILNCPAIEYITCTANNLTSIDVTQFPILKDL